jgi:hypothetical protein
MTHRPTTEAKLMLLLPSGPRVHAIDRPTTIGRDRKCDIVIGHPTVSRLHATIEPTDEGWRCVAHGTVKPLTMSTRDDRRGDGACVDLQHGQTLRFGRIRAHFFIGEVPGDFEIPDTEEEAGGHLVRCRCGRVGFVPSHDNRTIVRCKSCDAPIDWRPTVLNKARHSCGACHSDLKPGEAIWVCPRCLSVHHADCHAELGACATFGCGAQSAIEQPAIDLSEMSEHDTQIAEDALASLLESSGREVPDEHRALRWSQIVLLGLLGLMSFGLFAWALLLFWLVKRVRLSPAMYAMLALLGFAGVGVSIGWWIGGWR